jgi:hypothetical protein
LIIKKRRRLVVKCCGKRRCTAAVVKKVINATGRTKKRNDPKITTVIKYGDPKTPGGSTAIAETSHGAPEAPPGATAEEKPATEAPTGAPIKEPLSNAKRRIEMQSASTR